MKEDLVFSDEEFAKKQSKTNSRWILSIEGLPSWIVESVQLPTFVRLSPYYLSGSTNPISTGWSASFYNPIDINLTKLLVDWLKSDEKRNATFKLLTPDGNICETWSISDIEIIYITWPKIDYTSRDPILTKVQFASSEPEIS